jgi:hypothetical protein
VAGLGRRAGIDRSVRLSRPRPAGVVHRLAGLRAVARIEPLLHRLAVATTRGQPPRQRQRSVDGLGPQPRHLALRALRGHHRRPNSGSWPERLGLLAGLPADRDLAARMLDRRFPLRLLTRGRPERGPGPPLRRPPGHPTARVRGAPRDARPTAAIVDMVRDHARSAGVPPIPDLGGGAHHHRAGGSGRDRDHRPPVPPPGGHHPAVRPTCHGRRRPHVGRAVGSAGVGDAKRARAHQGCNLVRPPRPLRGPGLQPVEPRAVPLHPVARNVERPDRRVPRLRDDRPLRRVAGSCARSSG